MKKLMILFMVVGLGLTVFAGTTNFDALKLDGCIGCTDLTFSGLATIHNTNATTLTLAETTINLVGATGLYGTSTKIGFDAGAYLSFVIADTTGNVTITQSGTTKTVNWAAAGGFTFVGDVEVTGALTSNIAFADVTIISLEVGGGFGHTGVTISDAGVIQADGAITSTGTITGGTLTDGVFTVTGGTVSVGIWAAADVDITAGGTGASNAATARTNLGLAIGTNVQAWDAQLDDIAALVQSDSYIIVGDGTNWVQETGATARTSLGLTIGTHVQAYDADLTTYAGITPSANIQSLLAVADYAAARTALGLAIGTNVQAYDADLTTWANITPSANVQSLSAAANYAAINALLDLEIGTDVQAWDADLDTYAGITPSANVQSLLATADYAAMRTALSLVPGTDVQAWDAQLDDIAALVQSDSYIIVGDGTNWVEETGVTARASLGVAIGTDVQAYSADLASIATAATTATNEGVLFVGQFRIAYTQTSSYTVCIIPANADVLKIEVLTTTAFAGGSATAIDLGWTGNADSYANDLDIRAAGYAVAAEYGAMGDVDGANRSVLAQITTDDSSGVCTVLVYWTTGTPGTP